MIEWCVFVKGGRRILNPISCSSIRISGGEKMGIGKLGWVENEELNEESKKWRTEETFCLFCSVGLDTEPTLRLHLPLSLFFFLFGFSCSR